jgi:Trk K+ transport system NAD-binding subunit
VELTLDENSPADGKTVGELRMPPDCTLVAVVRDRHVIAPRDEMRTLSGEG